MNGYPWHQMTMGSRSPSPQASEPQSTLEVTGEGTVSAVADRAEVVLGVETEKPDLNAAQSENASQTAAVIAALRAMNIPPENIRTSEYRIEMQYDFVDGKQVFRGYKVTHMLTVTTDRVAEVGRLVDEAVAHGANVIRNIQFTTSKPEVYESQALAAAVKNARFKADSIASTLGVQLGEIPFKLQELTHSTEPVPYFSAKMTASPSTPIQPGQLTVRASIRSWYYYA